MSWDAWLFVAPTEAREIADIDSDYAFPRPSHVLDAARETFRAVTLRSPTSATVEGVEQFNLDLPDPDGSPYDAGIAHLHVRGGTDLLIPRVLGFAQRLGCRAFDLQTGTG